jgi:predicted RNA binding protein YcfA (HicA-like mRNA interferase family)
MSEWSSMKARRVLAALQRIGWTIKRVASSHKVLARDGWPDAVFALRDGEEIGPRALARIAKRTGLRAKDLQAITQLAADGHIIEAGAPRPCSIFS